MAAARPTFDADVIVAGAGPAGAVAALRLAEAGRRVLLCDRSEFPRDKACGDGLIADSMAALREVGLERQVEDLAYRTPRLRTISPGGVEVEFTAAFLVLPRLAFDNLLFTRAIAAGAIFRHLTVEQPLIEDGQIRGVIARPAGSREDGPTDAIELRAPLTLLATGAAGGVLQKFDAGARVEASGFAVRTYAEMTTPGKTLSELIISLERDLLPGYAWAFPAPGGVLNVGVGAIAGGGLRAQDINLRQRLDRLLTGHGRLGSLLGPMRAVDKYRGAPLRTGLTGSSLGQPGLAIIGEAAGTTYAVSGEGIGKAMESGILAADLVAAAGDALPSVGVRYAAEMVSRYAAKFRAYTTAERWVARPLVADYVASRANKSKWVHDRLTRVITEGTLPNRIFSAHSIWRLLTR